MVAKKSAAMTVSLEPTPKAAEAISLLQQAQGIVIADKASHEACRSFLKGAKALKREITEHYEAIKKPLNAAKATVLDMERRDLAPVDQAIAVAERLDTGYVREHERIEREAADKARQDAEAAERERREKEAAKAEAAALKLEASTNVLSPREERFVFEWLQKNQGPNDAARIAKLCGYANPQQAAERLINSEKIQQAISNAQRAAAIRRESEAKQAAPIVVDVPVTASQIGKVSGTSIRTYFSCGTVDLRALVLAVAENLTHGDGSAILALQPDMVYLNSQARDLKEMFSRVHPYAQLVKRDGVAG